jgi:radical SAM superfamily enzyme YgiQ (UPF0313 family)
MPNVGTDMSAAIKTIHKAGLEIIGSFVLGLDGDDTSTFKRTVAFAEQHKLAAAQFSVLTPFPGTVMRAQLEREGRIVDNDWSHYTMSNVVFRPRHMTELQLRQGQNYVYGRFYSIPSIIRRSLTLRGKLVTRLLVNLSYRGVGRGTGIARGTPAQEYPKRSPARELP